MPKADRARHGQGSDRISSRLIGRTLRQAKLPISIIVTTIERKHDLVVPDGDTVLEADDELVLIGQPSDIGHVRVDASEGFPADGATSLDRYRRSGS